jgi:hypothetical protein
MTYGRNVPVKDIYVKSYSFGAPTGGGWGWPTPWAPPIETKDAFGFHQPDLNDGSAGKYIYAFQEKYEGATPYPATVMEVGVIYGNSSSIVPPTGWRKIPGDLNEGAGGDYIYFVVKE